MMVIMSAVAVIECLTRKELSHHLVEQLRVYHRRLSELLTSGMVEEAMGQVEPLYEGCIEARHELQEHEKIHGCHAEIDQPS